MKISIITVVYNNAITLSDAIESVLSQTYSTIEYIVIDGNSTDGSKDIIKKYEGRITKWVSEPDKGMYDALNKGIAMATGDVIGFLHSDDLFDNTKTIEHIAELFSKTNCDAVYGNLVYVARNDSNNIIRFWQSNVFSADLLKQGWMPAHPTLFIKKNWYNELGGFDITYPVAADYDLMIRFLSSGKLKCEYLPEIITHMRLGGKSNKSIKNIIQKSKDDYRVIRKYKIGGFYTLFMKNFSKIEQFFRKK